MVRKLFRDEVIQRRMSEIGVPLGITRSWTKLYVTALSATLVIASLVVTYGSYSRKAHVNGYLLPDKGLIKVISTHAGRIAELHVVEGQHVNKDDVIFVVEVGASTTVGRTADLVLRNLLERKRLLGEELERLKAIQSSEAERLDVIVTSLKAQLLARKDEQAARLASLKLSRSAFDRAKLLQNQKVNSVSQSDLAEQNVVAANRELAMLLRGKVTADGELAQTQAQLHGLADKQANEKSQLLRNLAELDQQISEIKGQSFQAIRAAESGTITRITTPLGGTADPATPLLTIVPDNSKLQANLYVPSSAVGFVKSGAKVLLRYEAFPYQKFGSQKAEVISISRTSVNNRELPFPAANDEPFYLVTANISKDTVTAFGTEEPLQAGAKFQADLILDDRKIWEWAIEPILAARNNL